MRDFKGSGTHTRRNRGRRRLKLLGMVVLLALLLIPATVLLVRKGADAVAFRPKQPPTPPLPTGDALFPVACSLLPHATEAAGSLSAPAYDGTLLRYSINPRFQQEMQEYLEEYRPPYALFIALEPASGRILSLNASSQHPAWSLDAAYRLFPMASLFKVVTAAAALERGAVTPSTEMTFRGRAVSENPDGWDPHPRRGGQRMDLTQAMGKSVNPVYGKLASDLLGKQALEATCANFGFNRPLLASLPLQPSRAAVPDTVRGLRLMGSGLDHGLQVSPLHAAAITAAIANNGVMMAPRLVDSTIRDGQEVPFEPPRELARVVQPKVAEDLRRMLLTTVTSGTSGRAFRTHDGRRLLSVMQVAAKTGSISGDDPAGHYSWFTAYAPADNPKIAVLALVINDGRWRIKASQVGEHALTTFFKDEVEQAPPLPQVRASVRKLSETKHRKTVKTNRSQAVRKKSAQSSPRGTAG
ncbi:penicillin-binding transpeptidase domain-containing protein [Trichlorobacter ammonificans]|uniref:Penicillin binding protein transpeptidase domain-containing protein n=1 Tax=Trichlorobacter ammonificans TaxID=2916410 RepID=A0ABM9D5I6_9BACT|nr:penicillin-binding transpeptidase domain-containing protein [Trichlorobacter ammonificans]CAH2030500.1 Penicillin binding protein transpeptidase domain-containing protein [Trichlorobacter ammonificans]